MSFLTFNAMIPIILCISDNNVTSKNMRNSFEPNTRDIDEVVNISNDNSNVVVKKDNKLSSYIKHKFNKILRKKHSDGYTIKLIDSDDN